jgi:type I restriction enzyme R subunit
MGLLAQLGWSIGAGLTETLGPNGSLGRESKAEVVLRSRLQAALRKLNPSVPEAAIATAVDVLTRDRSAMGFESANREVYGLLKDGILVSLPDVIHGGQKQERVRVIDWVNPRENDFLVVNQLKIAGPMYSCIPDVLGFVNGLPLVLLEFKKPGVPAKQAFDDNITSYKHFLNGVPQLFGYNALLIASNGTDSRVGSLTADWERFFEWKRLEREDEPKTVSLETMIRGTCEPERLLDLVENFTLFSRHEGGPIKVLGQNHQFIGVNKAVEHAMEARREGHGRGGVFWQTQGSGKSFSMVFFAQKILRKKPGNWTFVIVTDRHELDDQIARTFKAVDAVTEAEGDECHAQSGAHLRELLRGNHRYVFTLIHKFQTNEMLCERGDVIVLVDEAHRSQYNTLAMNMRAALPNALFIAFTGTPLIAGEELTREIFGDYVSIYDFQQSVEDGATVPLFYENRTPELKLENPDLNDQIYDVIENADLDEEGQRRLDRELGRQYHLITRDDRLETVARDIVRHFLGRGLLGDGQPGKAMVVSIDKATAIKMFDKVSIHWSKELRQVENEIGRRRPKGEDVSELEGRRRILQTTDMAVIVSPGQNEIEQMQEVGLDIVRHRERMNKEPLDEKFKDTKDPLRLVFVCAMWLTGFDAPSCSTVYLDKPMRNHTLMQTIARANRVYPGKHSGMIVDYANVFLSLEKALAIYGTGGGGRTPVRSKDALLRELRIAVAEASSFCLAHGVDLDGIEALPVHDFSRLAKIGDAVDALIAPESLRKEFLGHERLVNALYNAVKPSPAVSQFTGRVACMGAIASAIRVNLNPEPVDISHLMEAINNLLDASITGVSIRVKETKKVDLSKIDFQALAKKFKESQHKNTEIEVLKAAIMARLNGLIELNKTRVDFLEKFQELIDAYNEGAANIEDLFAQLVEFAKGLSEEEQRHVRENVTEEELVLFDLLTRPAPVLNKKETQEVKKVCRDLLQRLRELLVLDWRSRANTRSAVRMEIQDVLDKGLPRAYDKQVFEQKCVLLFDHIFESYPDSSHSRYIFAG